MNKLLCVLIACLIVVGASSTAFAQPATPTTTPAAAAPAPIFFTTALGAGLVIIGAAIGIGRIGGSAVESMARQPEVATNVQTGMIISAALIEGAAFFALIICMLFNQG